MATYYNGGGGSGGRSQAYDPKKINTTATQTGAKTIKTTSQTGGNGNATTNVYNNAFETYKTNQAKVRDAQLGQLNTEYNNQQKQIESAYNGLNRNAYVTYMRRNLANRNAASNMGVNNSGMAENMQTANAVDYNRSVGNIGAYRQAQMSNAENTYNSNVANVNQQYDSDINSMQNQYAQAEIARNNELADLQSSQRFQAAENAKDRKQTAYEANRTYKQNRYSNRFQVFQNTVGGYTTTKSIDKKIKSLKNAKKNGSLKGWQKEYYSEIMSTLRAQRNQIRQKAKKK